MRQVVITARGHPNIRATHHKTLEVTGNEVITPRATCVIGVGADPFPAEVQLLRGRVEVTIQAGGLTQTGYATINPAHEVRERFVIRRSSQSDGDTLAVDASFAASDLDSALRGMLAHEQEPVTVTLCEAAPPPPLVLVGPFPQELTGHVAALARNAIEAKDSGAAVEALASRTTTTVIVPKADPGLAEAARLRARLFAPCLDPDVTALLAAGLPPVPSIRLGLPDRRSLRQAGVVSLLRQGLAPVVLGLVADTAQQVLDRLTADRVAIPDGVVDVGTSMRWVGLNEASDVLKGLDGHTVMVVPPRPEGGVLVDLTEVVRALRVEGVPARTLSNVLGRWQVSRKDIYGLETGDS
jgi:hypothetical protein